MTTDQYADQPAAMATDHPVAKVMGVMSKIWDYQPVVGLEDEWRAHAAWLAQAIATNRPRAEMDAYMSRVQMLMRMKGSMDFRKIVDRAIEELAAPPSAFEANRVEKLNPTAA